MRRRADVHEMYETLSGSKAGKCEGLLYLPEISAARMLLTCDGTGVQSKVISDIEKLSGAHIKVHEEPVLGRLVKGKGLSEIEGISKSEVMQVNTKMPQEDFTYRGRVYHGKVWGGTLHARFSDWLSKDLEEVHACHVLGCVQVCKCDKLAVSHALWRGIRVSATFDGCSNQAEVTFCVSRDLVRK